MGSTGPCLFEDDSFSQSGFHVACSAPRSGGAGGVTRETESNFSTLGARRAGHGARARARLAPGGSPVDSPSGKAIEGEIDHARPSQKRPAGRKEHDFTLLCCSRLVLGCILHAWSCGQWAYSIDHVM